MNTLRRLCRASVVLLAGATVAVAGAGDDGVATKPVRRSAASPAVRPEPTFSPERESVALAFVRQHYPDLAALLDRLAPMNRPEYEKAIVELAGVSDTLAALRQRDPRRYELALAAWKARSRVELLAAQLASRAEPDAALEARLRAALRDQIELEIRRQRFEHEQALARARRAEDLAERLERGRDELVRQRYQRLLREGRAARRRDRPAGAEAPADAARPGHPGEENPR